MFVYTVNLIGVFVFSYLSRIHNRFLQRHNVNGKKMNFWVLAALSSLIMVSGLRYFVGTDFGAYQQIYEIIAPNSPVNSNEIEVGFLVLCKLLSYLSKDAQIMFFVIAVITNLCIVTTLSKFCDRLELAMYLYITTFTYYGTFNGLRQYMASAIIFWAIRYLIQGKWQKYFLFVFIAFLFHTSALIMIPIYFIVRRDAWSWVNVFLLFVFLGGTLFYGAFLEKLFYFIGSSHYGVYKSVMLQPDNGANILRALVWIAPLSIAFINKKKLVAINPLYNYIINLNYIGLLFMVLALRHWLFARLCMYFDMYSLILIPQLTGLFAKSTNRISANEIMYIGLIVFYFLFSTALLLSGESNIYPYHSVFLGVNI